MHNGRACVHADAERTARAASLCSALPALGPGQHGAPP